MNAAKFLADLTWGLTADARRQVRIVALKAVVDDSGKGGEDVFILAGFVLHAEVWSVFEYQWDSVLKETPDIGYFKAKEAKHLTGEFRGFTSAERDVKVQRLVSVILAHDPLVLRQVIPIPSFEEHFKGKFATQMDYPYLLAYYSIIGVLAAYQIANNWHSSQTVDFVFDEQGKESIAPQMAWRFAKDSAPARIKPLLGSRPIHKDEKSFAPLQAADLVAWHSHRFYLEKSRGKVYDHPVWIALEQLKCVFNEMPISSLQQIATYIEHEGKSGNAWFEHTVPRKLRKAFLREWKRQKFGMS